MSRTAGPGVLIAACAVVVAFGTVRPVYNWDAIGYAAAAHAPGSHWEVHRDAYAWVRAAVPADAYTRLTDLDDYRRAVAGDSEALRQHLPFYNNKLLYVLLLKGAVGAGVNPVHAMRWISIVCAVLGLCLLWATFRPIVQDGALAVATVASLPMGVVYVARLDTPDAMAFAVAALIIRMFLRGFRWLPLLGVVFVAVRPDLWLLLFPVCLLVARDPTRRTRAVAGCMAALIGAVLISRVTGFHGWPMLFRFSFISITAYPETLSGSLAVGEYLYAVARMGWHFLREPDVLAFLVVCGGLVWTMRRRGVGVRAVLATSPGAAVACGLVYVALHTLTFPLPDIRFAAIPYALVLFGGAGVVWGRGQYPPA